MVKHTRQFVNAFVTFINLKFSDLNTRLVYTYLLRKNSPNMLAEKHPQFK